MSSGLFSAYVHIPFCALRCGYCDFNTYTVGFGAGADRESYGDSVLKEIDLSLEPIARGGSAGTTDLSRIYGERDCASGIPALHTIYFGGGTPTLLPGKELKKILFYLRERFATPREQLREISIEANPDTLTTALLDELAESGFTRVSIGMQSGVEKVLKTLERTHNPQRIPEVVAEVKSRGMQVSLDLIYGTPGEQLADWEQSLELALSTEPDHISAYSLVIEPGTKMGRKLKQGLIADIDPDEQAEKYELADRKLASAGYYWYEISNWAKPRLGEAELYRDQETNWIDASAFASASAHNLAYWRNQNWWGYGPGAHSHLNGHRFWNRKHPRAYALDLQKNQLPIQESEMLDESAHELERIMLGLRISSGLGNLSAKQIEKAMHLAHMGLVNKEILVAKQRVVLTLPGRLMADYVTQELLVD